MKVLFLCPRFDETAGDGRYALRLAGELAGQGVEVAVLTLRVGRFTLVRVQTDSPEHGATEDLGPSTSDLLRRNYYNASARAALRSVLAAFKPDVVHVHGIHQDFTLSCLLELKAYGSPLTITVHDYKIVCGNAGLFSDATSLPCERCLRGELLAPMRERCKSGSLLQSAGTVAQMALWDLAGGLKAFSSFLVASPFLVSLLDQVPAVQGRVKLIRFPRPSNDSVASTVSSTISIAFIGRFVPHKGPLIFARSMRGLDAPVHLFGSGPQEPEARAILATDPNVTFHGWTSQDQMSRVLGPGTIVVLPYLALETFCLAVAECMALGCCVVTTTRGAIPDLITDGVSGFMLSDPTPDAFRTMVEALMRDPARVRAVGARAREKIATLPESTAHAAEIIGHYRYLLSRGSS